MFKLQASTELFKNHKAAQVLSDQSVFQVLQTSPGQSLFFGMSDAQILYLSAERSDSATGWTPVDLTTELFNQFPNQTVTARSFAVEQNPATGDILIAQIVHIAETKSDALFVLAGLSNAPGAAWMQAPANRNWIARPYDDAKRPVASLQLAYVELPISNDPAQTPYIVAGVTDAATGFIQNYLVDIVVATGAWTIFPTAENFDELNDMMVGKPDDAMFAGLYQLYSLNGGASLTFSPWKGLFGPPDVTKLTPPAGASAISGTPTGPLGGTDLYVAGTGGIWLFAAGDQDSFSTGVQVISSSLIANVQYLDVHVAGDRLSIWGKSNNGVLFYSRGVLGSQADSTAWSAPIPIQQDADQVATMLDLATQTSVIYVHTAGANIVKLTQDPVTTIWRKQSILLPHLDINDVVEMYTWTTRLAVVDDNNLPLANQKVTITSTSPCSVYIDNAYMMLSPTIPLQAVSDGTGSITIVQETHTLGACCYNLVQGDGSLLNINPMSTTVDRLSAVKDGSSLSNKMVTDEFGKTTNLVPSTVPQPNTDAVAQGIVQFVKTAKTLPPDGSLQQMPKEGLRAFNPATDPTWGMKFSNGTISYYQGTKQMEAMGLDFSGPTVALRTETIRVENIWDAFEAFAGDIFRWIEHAIEEVEQFFIQMVDDIAHFFIQIGQALYHFVMKCVNEVVHAVQFILHAIEVAFEKLVQWLGFIFSWNDILRTHRVLKNVLRQFANYSIGSIGTAKTDFKNALTDMENSVNQWAGLPPVPGTAGSVSASGKRPAGSSAPQAHYGTSQAKDNLNSAGPNYNPPIASGSAIEKLVNEFLAMLAREGTVFTDAYETIKTQIVEKIDTLSIQDIVKRLLAVIVDLALGTIENAVETIMDILTILVQGVFDVLDTPIEIPVLSWLYSLITNGDKLSALDLGCLIAAIPVTIICKLTTETVPFPDDAFTDQVINAPDFATLQKLYGGNVGRSRDGGAGGDIVGQPDVSAILNLVGSVTACFGTFGVIIVGSMKFATPKSLPIAIGYAVVYLLYVAPDVMGLVTNIAKLTWDVTMNFVVCVVSVVKTFVDISLCKYDDKAPKGFLKLWNKASPGVECFINFVWQFPVSAVLFRNPKASDIVGFIANTSFDIGGMLTPGTAYPPDDKVKLGFFIVTLVCAGIYGDLSLIQGLMVYNGS